jgi:hypothetical protein
MCDIGSTQGTLGKSAIADLPRHRIHGRPHLLAATLGCPLAESDRPRCRMKLSRRGQYPFWNGWTASDAFTRNLFCSCVSRYD